ncbi:hypothetical protein IWZ01DRAFT_515462 [Phyllosticta capitalensis]
MGCGCGACACIFFLFFFSRRLFHSMCLVCLFAGAGVETQGAVDMGYGIEEKRWFSSLGGWLMSGWMDGSAADKRERTHV